MKKWKQIYKDIRCALGLHYYYTWTFEPYYKNMEVTNCFNCNYGKQEDIQINITGEDIELDEHLREVKKVDIR